MECDIFSGQFVVYLFILYSILFVEVNYCKIAVIFCQEVREG